MRAEKGLKAGEGTRRLGEILEAGDGELRRLASEAEGRYHRLRLPRPGRSPRVIDAPDRELKAVQRKLLRRLIRLLPVSRHAHGFVPRRSPVTAARPHVGKEWVVTFDVRDFFPSVRSRAVREAAAELGLSGGDGRLLVRLTTLRGRLPQGAPTSPALANVAFSECDARLAGLASSLGLAYTRYADDLAFSGDRRAGRLQSSVSGILRENGFRLAAEKTRVMPRSRRQEVCGLVVNDGVRLPREQRRKLRAIAHEVSTGGLDRAARGRGSGFPRWLGGHLAYLCAVDRKAAERLISAVEGALRRGS
ncbi:MAG: reverse transcriptase family protein [Planctomycetota bacterium]|jgi:hypothetical protein